MPLSLKQLSGGSNFIGEIVVSPADTTTLGNALLPCKGNEYPVNLYPELGSKVGGIIQGYEMTKIGGSTFTTEAAQRCMRTTTGSIIMWNLTQMQESLDEGVTWTQRTFTRPSVNSIMSCKGFNDDTLYTADGSNTGGVFTIYRSTNLGETWSSQTVSFDPAWVVQARAIAVNNTGEKIRIDAFTPSIPITLPEAKVSTIYSTNSGATFSVVTGGPNFIVSGLITEFIGNTDTVITVDTTLNYIMTANISSAQYSSNGGRDTIQRPYNGATLSSDGTGVYIYSPISDNTVSSCYYWTGETTAVGVATTELTGNGHVVKNTAGDLILTGTPKSFYKKAGENAYRVIEPTSTLSVQPAGCIITNSTEFTRIHTTSLSAEISNTQVIRDILFKTPNILSNNTNVDDYYKIVGDVQ
jgi:hypothetical protein